MKSYTTINEEGESKSLTNAVIPETGGSPYTKKHQVILALALVAIGFVVGHLTNTDNASVYVRKESMAKQLVENKESSMAAQLVDSIDESDWNCDYPWCCGDYGCPMGCQPGYCPCPGNGDPRCLPSWG